MVMLRALVFILFCAEALPAVAVTADELRGGSAERDREVIQRQNRANTNALGDLLPPDKSPKSSKYSGKKSEEVAAGKKAKTKIKSVDIQPAASAVESSNIYIPPPRTGGTTSGQPVVTDAVQATTTFGIRLGTWLSASLNRNTTSADSGTIELTLTADAIGDRRTLPTGTTLFAEKSLNSATKRLEMLVTHGITPNGVEFEMRGIVFDPQKTPGLAGVYVIDKKEVASRGVSKGVIAAAGAAAASLGGSVAGAGVNAASQSVLNDANQVTDSNATSAIIYVSPQALIIRVEKQF